MPRRAVSPAASEPELDILGSLYPGDDDNGAHASALNGELDIDGILNVPGPAEDGDDEAFIALQQAASYRKNTNLKGRTVKKGGGFQAMGTLPLIPERASRRVLTASRRRPQCQSAQGHHSKGFFRSYTHSEENDTPSSRQERCRGHGADRLRQDGRLRHTYDRAPART